MTKTLVFKWTVSRGRDTYGYNICSLWVNDKKVSSCNGGGYDMKGTALGYWMKTAFQDELNKLAIPWCARNGEKVQEHYGLMFHDPNYDPSKAEIDGETIEQRERDGKSPGLEKYQAFHSASSSIPTKRHTIAILNGACSFSSMERILKALGYTLDAIHDLTNIQIYQLRETA